MASNRYFQEYIFGEHLNCCSLILACDTSHGWVSNGTASSVSPFDIRGDWGDALLERRINGPSGIPAVGPDVVLVT